MNSFIYLVYFQEKHNIPVPFIYDLSDEYNFYPTLHPKVYLIIQYKMFTPVNTGSAPTENAVAI